jgi:tetratricopeptide (TPR) repeat protein
VRSIRLANTLAWISAWVGAGLFVLLVDRSAIPRWMGAKHVILVDPAILILWAVFAYSSLILSIVGRFDPVVAWAANPWDKADYGSALFRVQLFSWRGWRAPSQSLLLTSANFPDRAYAVLTNSKLAESDLEEPSYNFDFAAGHAALAQGNLELARHHFERLYARFPSSALARYALGDLLLWQNVEFGRAHELLTTALADPFRMDLPHWKRLGFEAQLRASHAWALAAIGRPEELQYNLDLATELAGRKKPVQAEVHLRLGYALRALEHFAMAHEHWRAAREIDPRGWAGSRAARAAGERYLAANERG